MAEGFQALGELLAGGVDREGARAEGRLAGAKSVDALKKAAGEEDAFVRIAAVWALANIGDAGSASVLTKAADDKGDAETENLIASINGAATG